MRTSLKRGGKRNQSTLTDVRWCLVSSRSVRQLGIIIIIILKLVSCAAFLVIPSQLTCYLQLWQRCRCLPSLDCCWSSALRAMATYKRREKGNSCRIKACSRYRQWRPEVGSSRQRVGSPLLPKEFVIPGEARSERPRNHCIDK